jgi:hypothetical protein
MSNKASDMRELVYAAAGPRERFENRKRCMDRAARNAGLRYRTVRAVFYGEIKDTDHKAIRALRRAAIQHSEAKAHVAVLERQVRVMDAADPEMFGPAIAALRDEVRALRELLGA